MNRINPTSSQKQEYCPCCGVGFSRTIKPAVAVKLTDPMWLTDFSCSIFINQSQPSLALVFFLREQQLTSGSLHLCQGKYLHYHSEGIDDRIPIKFKSSIRTQATRIVDYILGQWSPAKTFIGTGNPDTPQIVSDLELPKIWEKRLGGSASSKSVNQRRSQGRHPS
jgi:hypothetical protein